MNQTQLITAMADRLREAGHMNTKAAVETVLQVQADVIREHLASGDADGEPEVTLLGLGKFVVVTRAARPGRNPQTGAAVEIPERRAVTFRASKALKDALTD